jgi:ABC-type transport system involved in cytochrome c biogenesis permease subunit
MDALVRWAVLQGPFALASIAPGGVRDLTILVASGWMLYLFYTTMIDPDQRGLHDRFLNTRVSQED